MAGKCRDGRSRGAIARAAIGLGVSEFVELRRRGGAPERLWSPWTRAR